MNIAGFLSAALLILASGISLAEPVERIHFLIPGGAGGGWDSTARGVGEALGKSGLVSSVSFQNLSGGGGGTAIAHLVETADRQHDTLLISSTPIILRAIRKVFPQSWRDLTPVAAVVVDYGAFVVKADSPFQTWTDVLEQFRADPRSINIAGGSATGSMDHLVAALAFKASGEDPLKVKYIPYNAGGKAMVGLLSGECQLLSTGYSEALGLSKQGEVRILVMTGPERLKSAPGIPTLREQGANAVFLNWRGLFGPPGLPSQKVAAYRSVLGDMYTTPEWGKIRTSRGWTDFFLADEDFTRFLVQQEQEMSDLLIQLGFVKR